MKVLRALARWGARSTPAHVGFAFLAMGGWAVFANRAHPLGEALLAGFVQGAISAGLTFCLKQALERLSFRFRGASALWAPPLITAAAILAILLGVHWGAGTPEIAATIAVPFSVSTTYACIYNWSLRGKRVGGPP